MTAYYNEIDEYAADWLEALIAERLIADGVVDRRSIADVRPADLDGFTQCHFFAGLGGWPLSFRRAGWPDTRPVWSGSCPCQPFSLAGARKGFADERHLWPVWHELIRERRPATVFGEQVASAAAWLRLVRGDLEALGYAVGAIPIEAASAGADHLRDRFWFVADADFVGSQGREALPKRAGERAAGPDGLADADGAAVRHEPGRCDGAHGAGARIDRDDRQDSDVADCESERRPARDAGSISGAALCERSAQQFERRGSDADASLAWVIGADEKARRVKPGIRLLAHGVPTRVAKLRAFGNAIDPRPAAEFIRACL